LLKACSKLADNLEQAVRAQLADRLATIKMWDFSRVYIIHTNVELMAW
jgi:hypothetical protein